MQAALYVLARAVPDALGLSETAHLTYRLRIRLEGEDGSEIAADEVDAEQRVSLEPVPDEWAIGEADHEGIGSPAADESAGEPAPAAAGSRPHASLVDFQAMIDRVVLEPSSPTAVSGLIAGRLFGFERLIGPFEVLVAPC